MYRHFNYSRCIDRSTGSREKEIERHFHKNAFALWLRTTQSPDWDETVENDRIEWHTPVQRPDIEINGERDGADAIDTLNKCRETRMLDAMRGHYDNFHDLVDVAVVDDDDVVFELWV